MNSNCHLISILVSMSPAIRTMTNVMDEEYSCDRKRNMTLTFDCRESSPVIKRIRQIKPSHVSYIHAVLGEFFSARAADVETQTEFEAAKGANLARNQIGRALAG